MYHQVSKRAVGLAMTFALLANVAALPVLAEETGSASTVVKTRSEVNFCTRLEQSSTKLDSNMADRTKKLDDQSNLRNTNLEKNRSDRDEKLTEQRSNSDKNVAERYAKMEGKAKNDAQRIALENFHTAMLAALNTRKAAFDAARTTFRAGIDEAIAARKAAIQSAVRSFQTALKDAETKAKADCAGGVAPATAKTNFETAVKTAREKFAADRKAVERLGVNLKTLTDARKTALDKARADFKAAVEKATKDLKAALLAARPVKTINKDGDHKTTTTVRNDDNQKTEEPKEVKPEHEPKKVALQIVGSAFQPLSQSVVKGDTVVWTNNDSVPHTVTAADGSFDSGTISPGASYSHTFTSVGTVSYSCAFHPSMHGSVTVTE
ncbi:MAG TPA: plastocyanin/azurin family copper-binding protein [Candidatus Udaeobacter sp.]|nr:plastocyanin/azurin family copper-binding protein [Candidatus Udaeobacter sp.]